MAAKNIVASKSRRNVAVGVAKRTEVVPHDDQQDIEPGASATGDGSAGTVASGVIINN